MVVSKRRLASIFIVLMAMLAVISIFSIGNSPLITKVYATNDLEDDLAGQQSQQSSQQSQSSEGTFFDEIAKQEIGQDDKDFASWIGNQGGLSNEQMETASRTMSPVVNLIGYVTGAIIVLLMTGITLITALDLLYITVPPIRGLLYKGGQGGQGGMPGATGGVGGLGGFGRRYGAMGANGQVQGHQSIQWISDEAIACVALLGGSAQTGTAGMQTGAVGGMAMPNQQPQSTKSVIGTYFRKKLFFILLLAICLIVLTSSVVLNCGINLGQWVLKIISMFNGKLGG